MCARRSPARTWWRLVVSSFLQRYRKDGSLRVMACVPMGKHTARATFDTKKEAESWAEKTEKEYADGTSNWSTLCALEDAKQELRVESMRLGRDISAFDLLREAREILRLLARASLEITPRPGVYLLFNDGDQVVYVGQSQSVACRLSGHIEKEFVKVRMIPVASLGDRLRFERALIRLLRPKYNIQHVVEEPGNA